MDQEKNSYWNQLKENSEEIWNVKTEIVCSYNFVGSKILDIGGSGVIFPDEFIRKNELHVIDIDDDALKVASSKGCKAISHDLNLRDEMPFEENRFDVVIAFDIIEHVADPGFVMKEICRVMKNEGCFFVGLPNSFNFLNRISFIRGKSYDITDMGHFCGDLFSDHLHLISLEKAKRILDDYGFGVEKSIYYLQKKVRHKKMKYFQFILFLMNLFKLNLVCPRLFSFAFIFACRRTNVSTDN